MQLKTILTALAAVIIVAAASTADTNNEDLNDANKIIYFPGGSRPPKIITIRPSGPYGPIYLKRNDVDELSKSTVYYKPGVGYYPPPTYYPFPRKRHDEDRSSKKKTKVESKSSKKKKANGTNEADVDHEDLDWEDDGDEGAKYIWPPTPYWYPRPSHPSY